MTRGHSDSEGPSTVHRATLREVAERAGVHPATASRALNAATESMVNATTAARIQKVAKELGYSPNPIARSLKTSRSTSIGLVIPDLTNPLFPPIVRGVEDVLRPAGYNAWIVNTDSQNDIEAAAVVSLRQRNVEGFVFATALLDHPLLKELAESSMPVVLVNRSTAIADIPSVTPDDAAGSVHGRSAPHRPRSPSHRPPRRTAGHLHGRDSSQGVPPGAGGPRPASRRGQNSAVRDVVGGCRSTRHEESLLDSDIPFTAVFAGNDQLALGALDALAERGLTVPGRRQRRRVQRHSVHRQGLLRP